MKTVKLYGEMGRLFGKVHRLAVENAAEAIRALCVTREGFRAYLHERHDAPFQVLVGEAPQDEQGLQMPVGSMEVIKIVPVVAGAKDGLGQVLLGAALIVASAYIPGSWTLGAMSVAGATASIGMAMVLGGIASMLAKTPNENYNASGSSEAENFTFSNPTLTTGQGGPVPLGYGEMTIGGVVISCGINAETWQDKGFGGAAPDNAGTRGGDGSASPWVWAIAP